MQYRYYVYIYIYLYDIVSVSISYFMYYIYSTCIIWQHLSQQHKYLFNDIFEGYHFIDQCKKY